MTNNSQQFRISPVETKFIITASVGMLLTYILDYTNHRCKQLHAVVQPLSRECNLLVDGDELLSCACTLFLSLSLSHSHYMPLCLSVSLPHPMQLTVFMLLLHLHQFHSHEFELCCYANVRKEELFISSYKRHFYFYSLHLA